MSDYTKQRNWTDASNSGTTIYASHFDTEFTAIATAVSSKQDSSSATGGAPTGTIAPFATATAPSGWVLCDGSAYNGGSADYTDLWNLIGNTFGGTGVSDFEVPDLRGRIVVAQAGSGTFTTIGNTGGNETHTLTTSEIPSHTHSLSDPSIGYADGSTADLGTGQSIVGAVHTVTVGTTGGGSAHNIMNPYMVFPYIIKL